VLCEIVPLCASEMTSPSVVLFVNVNLWLAKETTANLPPPWVVIVFPTMLTSSEYWTEIASLA